MNKLNLLTYAQLASGDAVERVNSVGAEIVVAMQQVGGTGAAIAFSVGALYHMFGGDRGRDTAFRWYKGGAIGLIVLLSAFVISQFIVDKATF